MKRSIAKIGGALIISIAILLSGCDQPTKVTQQEKESASEKAQTQKGDPIEGQYIVSLETDFTGTQADKAEQTGALINRVTQEYSIVADNVKNRYRYAFRGFTAQLNDEQLGRLQKDDRVQYIEQDQIVTLAPPGSCRPWPSCRDDSGDDGDLETTPWGITRVGGPISSNGTAWVIDTGIDLDHPDLNVDTQRSATFVSQGKGSKSADDNNGHGTHVAGTIAAIDNDIDVVGVAAGATVVAVKVLDHRGSGSYSDVIAGIDYVAQEASSGEVANLSLGGSPSQAVDDAVRNAADQGILFAIAAGNDSDDANNYSPARVEYSNVWTISAIDDTDTFADFSNYSGPTDPPIEFTAPGVEILSLYLDGGTTTLDGTSMASPHAAGILLISGGSPSTDGTASSDPDGDPDPIIFN